MNQKKQGAFATLFAALSGSSSAQPMTADAPCPAIVAAGEAVVRSADAREPEAAQQQSANAMSSVQAKVKARNIPTDAIRTVRYDVQPRYDYVTGRQTLRRYVATN